MALQSNYYPVPIVAGTTAGTYAAGDDPRLSDERTPPDDVVTNAKLANVATATIKGRATAGTGDPEDLTATQVRTILNVADGAEVNVQSNWTESDSGSDAFILNKPSIPTASSATPQALGVAAAGTSTDFARADHVHAMPSAADVGAATSAQGALADTAVQPADLATVATSGDYDDLTNKPTLGTAAAQDSTAFAAASHTHAASDITSGTLDIARLPTGTGSTQVALGDHTHTQLHDKSHSMTDATSHTAGNHKVFYSDGSGQIQELALGNSGEVLTSNGATSAPSFAAASGGVSAIGTSAADILSVSGSDLVADDLGADKLYGWDDSASKAIGFTIGSGLETDTTTLKAKITSDPTGVTGADAITNIMSLTQAEYNAIGSPNASTLYVITDP